MIKLSKKIFLLHVLLISSCSSLDVLKENYQNFLSTSSNKFYVVEEGDSIWSIALRFNLDTELLISKNNLKRPYTIYPNQKLVINIINNKKYLSERPSNKKWTHPLKEKSESTSIVGAWLVFKEIKGMPIHSIHNGKVVVSGPDIPGYGNLVMISHPGGYLSLYAHCDKIFVNQGDEVDAGEMIARLGNSEAAFPMLRFQLRKNGKPLRIREKDLLF